MANDPSVDFTSLASCALRASRAQTQEDLVLLPTLLASFGLRAGTFVELGAYTGIALSNTLMLEHCLGWHGLLIEANPSNFARLNSSGRRAAKVHSAVCEPAGTATVTTRGQASAGQLQLPMSTASARGAAALRRRYRVDNTSVEVPCSPLPTLMRAHAALEGADFLSLDVEGAESTVLETVGEARGRRRIFGLALVELDAVDMRNDTRVSRRLRGMGLTLSRTLRVPRSGVFVSSGVRETPLPRDGPFAAQLAQAESGAAHRKHGTSTGSEPHSPPPARVSVAVTREYATALERAYAVFLRGGS